VPAQDCYPNPDTYDGYDGHGDTTAITSPVNGAYTDTAAINDHLAYDAAQRPITLTHLEGGVPITISLAYNADGLRVLHRRGDGRHCRCMTLRANHGVGPGEGSSRSSDGAFVALWEAAASTATMPEAGRTVIGAPRVPRLHRPLAGSASGRGGCSPLFCL